jgi:hypothetical protein
VLGNAILETDPLFPLGEGPCTIAPPAPTVTTIELVGAVPVPSKYPPAPPPPPLLLDPPEPPPPISTYSTASGEPDVLAKSPVLVKVWIVLLL